MDPVFFSGVDPTRINQTVPSNIFSGRGTFPPDVTADTRLAYPAATSGLDVAPGAWAVKALDEDLGQVALKLAPLLAPNLPEPTRASAAGAAALLNGIRAGYAVQLAGNGYAASWNRPAVRQALQKYRVALALVDQAADHMTLGLQGVAVAPAPATAPIHWPGGMGIFSWNPNLWGKTEEEAQAYELQQAQANVKLQAAAAAATDANPGLLDTVKKSLGDLSAATATATSLAMFAGVAGVAAIAYWMFKEPERGARTVGTLAEGGAHAGATFVKGAATAAKL